MKSSEEYCCSSKPVSMWWCACACVCVCVCTYTHIHTHHIHTYIHTTHTFTQTPDSGKIVSMRGAETPRSYVVRIHTSCDHTHTHIMRSYAYTHHAIIRIHTSCDHTLTYIHVMPTTHVYSDRQTYHPGDRLTCTRIILHSHLCMP